MTTIPILLCSDIIARRKDNDNLTIIQNKIKEKRRLLDNTIPVVRKQNHSSYVFNYDRIMLIG